MRNYRVGRIAEIDIIAEKDEYICFIEVKTRTGKNYGYGREAVDMRKRKKIRIVAKTFLSENNITEKCVRFDVIEINYSGCCMEVNFIENAF